ncbi:hypothetical protein PLESTF_000895600 [Pleodorina starrii]|nr:hypothetical protein PLESTM_002050900 [Pleodorina starrii]GLC69916.1 hypothetical protein PLESTF_000895600 [Pleodorina starrii]
MYGEKYDTQRRNGSGLGERKRHSRRRRPDGGGRLSGGRGSSAGVRGAVGTGWKGPPALVLQCSALEPAWADRGVTCESSAWGVPTRRRSAALTGNKIFKIRAAVAVMAGSGRSGRHWQWAFLLPALLNCFLED